MRTLDRRDIVSALATGLTTGVIGWRILAFLGRPLPLGVDPFVLVPLVPFLWLAGVQLGYFLGRFMAFFTRFGRFAAIGFANAAVDFGVLYLLIGVTGFAAGVWFTVFKTFSFLVAMTHSYFWNKNWAFDSGSSRGGSREVLTFAAVSVLSLVVNVGVASAVVNVVGPLGGLDANAWAGIGAIAGSAVALIFSFAGYKMFVFHK
ncbi:MAG TPA: GtrA family protein [Candidatus Paceibacterota bacterium]|nr:GtrA family protein [Candidatus Paceibacterota bacterium]